MCRLIPQVSSSIVLGLILVLGSGTPPCVSADTRGLHYLALGDSYTIGRSVVVAGRWPVQLSKALAIQGHRISPPRILARSGWTSRDLLVAMRNVQSTEQYDLVSVLIGVNNQFQELNIEDYRRDLAEIFTRAISASKRGRRGVFALSIPDYGVTPYGIADAEEISPSIDRWNAVYRTVANEFKLKFFDVTRISRQGAGDDSLVSFDRLHPSAKMYHLWVDAIAPEVVKLIEELK